MKILIIGGAGFVGSNLAFHLKEKHKITVMDNLVRRGSEINIALFRKSGINFVHGDIRNKEDFNKFKIFDLIIECAAQPSACAGYENPEFDIQNNYFGLLNTLEYARKTNAALIFFSTNKVYSAKAINNTPLIEIDENFSIDGGDHSIYGLSKACADLTCQEWAKSFNMPIIINRFSCLAGPGQFGKSEQGWVAWFVIAALFNLPIELYGFNGKQVRDVLFIPDILDLIDIQMKKIYDLSGEVFNIGGGHGTSISLLECISLIEKLTDKKINWRINKNPRKADHCVYISDISKANKILNWKPRISLTQGLNQIIKWVNKNEKQLRSLYEV